MEWRIGLVVAGLLGCGDDRPAPVPDLVGDLSVESVADVSSSRVRAISIAGIDVRTFMIARATTQGADFCAECLGSDPTDCAATCRRAVLEVTRYRTSGASDPPGRFYEAFPETAEHDVDAIDVVALDDTHAGVAWLECDGATCGASAPRRSCTARYTTVDLLTSRRGPIQTLYQGWYGDLQLAFDPRARRLLALVGKPPGAGVGVRAAIYDEQGAALLAPWQAYGGAAAGAPVATAGVDGFLIAADDPAPGVAAPSEPCADACDCGSQTDSDPVTGGLYAFRPGPGIDRPAERISPGRGADGAYVPREAIAAIDAGGRVVVASSQPEDGAAELFEPAVGGWTRRHSSQPPAPLWLGALGDATHLAWIGSDRGGDPGAPQHLVAGVVAGDLEQRGQIAELASGAVLRAAPVRTGDDVTTTFLLRGVAASGDPGAPPERFEVLAVRASWRWP